VHGATFVKHVLQAAKLVRPCAPLDGVWPDREGVEDESRAGETAGDQVLDNRQTPSSNAGMKNIVCETAATAGRCRDKAVHKPCKDSVRPCFAVHTVVYTLACPQVAES
jgi:hypothetical protein